MNTAFWNSLKGWKNIPEYSFNEAVVSCSYATISVAITTTIIIIIIIMLFKKHVCLPCPLCLILLYFGISIFIVANSEKLLLFVKAAALLFYYIIFFQHFFIYSRKKQQNMHLWWTAAVIYNTRMNDMDYFTPPLTDWLWEKQLISVHTLWNWWSQGLGNTSGTHQSFGNRSATSQIIQNLHHPHRSWCTLGGREHVCDCEL